MYNLHTHSLLSDGVLLPSEIAVRFQAKGYKAIAITDHVDCSNIKAVVSQIVEFCKKWPKESGIKILPGIEITHAPLSHFKPLAQYARSRGVKIIIGHGQTPVEPVIKGTNRAALEADIDILAHPGLIFNEDVLLAKKKNIFLEITARSGHKETNSFVAKRALESGANLMLALDSHTPEDIISPGELIKVGFSAGLNQKEIDKILANTKKFIESKK